MTSRQKELFRVHGVPVLQNKVYADPAAARASPVGDVLLVQDLATGLVHNAAFDPRLLCYDTDYQNEQAFSGIFQQHLDAVTAILRRHWSGRRLLEVGCGKGWFLEHLQRQGFAITGVDPAYEGDNPAVVRATFAPGPEQDPDIRAEAIVLRHVLEHMQDPVAFLADIAAANGGQGQIYIEVPCFDWICTHRAWFDIFYEHVNYFRLGDFHRMFGRVHDSGHVFGGQYLYVVADIATLRRPQRAEAPLDFPADFLGRLEHVAAVARSQTCTVWGGSSKGVIFALHMQRAGVHIARAIDINPAKQGRCMAVSGVPIVAPDAGIASLADGDPVFVMNSNYLPEIRSMTNNRFDYIRVDHHEF